MAYTPTFIWKKATVIAKKEVTPGTPVTLAASDFAAKVFDVGVDTEIEYWVNEYASGMHTRGPGTMGKRKATFTFKAGLLPSSVDEATAPKLSVLLQGCGLLETVNADTSVVYTPVATKDEQTLTMAVIFVSTAGSTANKAIRVDIKGAMGNCVFGLDSLGNPVVLSFTFTGAFVGISDGTELALTSPDTGYAIGILNSAVDVESVTYQISKFSLDPGNSVEIDVDPDDSTGYMAAYIAKREPKLSLDPKAKLLSDDPGFTNWAAGNQLGFSSISSNGTVQFVLAAPAAQMKTNKPGKRGEEVTYEREFDLNSVSGNDEWSLTQQAQS